MMSDGAVSVLEHFLSACEAWNLDEVHRVVESGFNVDAFDDDHVTGLQMAAATGNIGIVEYLVDNGADIEKSNQVGMTPLHHACRNGHINVVRILVQRGANYQKLTYLGASSMTLAAAGGHIELVKLLLDLRVSVNPSHTALCPTPIIAAAFRRHTHICALLTHRGAYVDGHIQRLWNLSALSTAISCGATSVVSALLELGANASFRSLGGRTATELASALNREDALAVIKTALRSSIKEEKPKEVDLRERILARDEVAVRVALRRGTTCTTFAEGCTPLMYAILLADITIVKAIMEENANIDAAESVSGLTALMLAAIVGDSEIIECLLNAGADASLTSFEGLTALDYALTSGLLDAEVLCLLQRHLEHGSLPPAKSEIHQQLSRVIHTGKSKILNKISTHVGLSVSLGSIERKDANSLPREHFGRLLRAASDGTQAEFVLASDMLRSIGHHGRPTKNDPLQSCIRIARYIAEQRATHIFAPLPIAFIGEESQCENSISAKYGNSIDSSISGKSQSSERQKEYFSLAQRNADLFYEYRFPKGESRRGKIGNLKTRLLFDDENRRKISSSTSASGSEDKSPPRAQGYSFFERGSTSTLGTTPRVRVRSRETVTLDDDEKSSPSRLSLNQYTFALKDDKTTLRKSTSSPMLGTMICRSSSANCLKVTNSARNSARNAVSTLEHGHRRRHHTVTEDSLWMELREAGLGAYVDLLKAEEVDKATFVALTNDDLMHLGITNTLHRQTLLKIAKAVRHM
uniref:NAD(+) ADP-ribosyltransferase n=1 Tax=Ascaris suum TaxID=6253 RepID=F1KXQ9_ASCSU